MTSSTNATTDSLHLTSFYLAAESGRAHQFELHLGPEREGHREGRLLIDPNRCGLDGWGDRTVCTRMASRSLAVVATRMRTLDPTGRGRLLHRLACAEFAPGESADLIEYPRAGLWYVVYNPGVDDGARVVPLFAAELFKPVVADDIVPG